MISIVIPLVGIIRRVETNNYRLGCKVCLMVIASWYEHVPLHCFWSSNMMSHTHSKWNRTNKLRLQPSQPPSTTPFIFIDEVQVGVVVDVTNALHPSWVLIPHEAYLWGFFGGANGRGLKTLLDLCILNAQCNRVQMPPLPMTERGHSRIRAYLSSIQHKSHEISMQLGGYFWKVQLTLEIVFNT